MKKWIVAFVVGIVALRGYFRLTDDFRLGNIQHELPYHAEWDFPARPEVEKILQQPFHYIGKGSQSYAFANGEYVIKFFKYKHLRPHWLLELLSPLPYFNAYEKKQRLRKQRKLDHLFAGYHLAWTELRGESGLIFVHLNETKGLYPTITLYDKIGLKRHVELDSVVFILQKRAQTTRTVIDSLLAKNDLQMAQKRLRQILELYASEYKRGLYDMDHGVMHNTGFVGEEPIHLDIGKLAKEPRTQEPEFVRSDIQNVLSRIDSWLKTAYPDQRDELIKNLQKEAQELFGA